MNLTTTVSPFHPTMNDINALGGYRAAQAKNIAYTLTSDIIPEIEAIVEHEDTKSIGYIPEAHTNRLIELLKTGREMKESISHTGNRFARNVTDTDKYDTIGFKNDLHTVVSSYDTVATTAKKLLPSHVRHKYA